MKLIRTAAPGTTVAKTHGDRLAPWKILVVDDEPDVHALTSLNLKGFQFAGRGITLIAASSAAEAIRCLDQHTDIAMALIDVVMETDDAGLELVRHIRNDRHNWMIRLIIRTGQPGAAPERFVIDNFDIDDYKDKTELTAQKLYTSVRSALKAYRDLETIEMNRRGLECVLEATPQLYGLRRQTLESFLEGVLTQVIATCKLVHTGLISTIEGVLTTLEGNQLTVRCGTGELDPATADPERLNSVIALCTSAARDGTVPSGLRAGAMIAPMRSRERSIGFIYLEVSQGLTEDDRALIQVLANQCSAAIENYCLHADLRQTYEQLVDGLALTAEFKDCATGIHIRRLAEYTRLISHEMGVQSDLADEFAAAARLHDVGKVGVPDAILNKPGPLTAEEFDIIKRHAEMGATILSAIPALALAREVALSHHERWNGQGYPHGLKGLSIPLVCRIVAVADVFDALSSRRPYKSSWPPEKAMAEILRGSGDMFDPDVVAAMLKLYRAGAFAHLLQGLGDEAG